MSEAAPPLLYWHWAVFGLALMSVEAFAPGAFFLWLGLSCLGVGAVLWLTPALSLQSQILWLAALVFGSLLPWWKLRRRSEVREPAATPLNERASLYRGRRYTLAEPIVDGRGTLRVDDGLWHIAGPDLPAGAAVRVRDIRGNVMQVEKAD